MSHSSKIFDLLIAGAGLAGLTAAHMAARAGFTVALVAPRGPGADGRTTALLQGSVEILERAGLWPAVEPKAAALRVMRIIDDTDRLLRAPPVEFRAAEIDLAAFGYNVRNRDLVEHLAAAVSESDDAEWIDGTVETLAQDDGHVNVTMADGQTLSARIVIGADGRNSTVRHLAGIRHRTWAYPQRALVLDFEHALPHEDVSTEFHTRSGPFTQVPLPGDASSLVWVETPHRADEISALAGDVLDRLVEDRMHSVLGRTKVTTAVQGFPLGGLRAEKMAAGRVFLIGDAAHAIPPIGAQGFNLGLRDVDTLMAVLGKTGLSRVDEAVREFNRRRAGDVASRAAAVDLLNRSLLSDFVPVQAMRSVGLFALSAMPPLRRALMREGVAPGTGFPSPPWSRPPGAGRHAE